MPNSAVAMDAWALSACYPQSTFYPLSNDDSTFHRWITRTCFRNCSTCLSYSKAHFYPYALHTIANRAECTFVLLRYSLGGNRPSQTDPLTRSPARIHGTRVRYSIIQGWYFTVDSTGTSVAASQSPTYPTHKGSNNNIRLQ